MMTNDFDENTWQDKRASSSDKERGAGYSVKNDAHLVADNDVVEDIDIKSLFLIFWKRRFLIVFLVVLGVVGSLFITNLIKPVFTARSYILIESQKDIPSEIAGFIKDLKVEDSVILSEAQIIKSRSFALKVVEDLDLVRDPEFKRSLQSEESKLNFPFISEITNILSGSAKDVPESQTRDNVKDVKNKGFATSPALDFEKIDKDLSAMGIDNVVDTLIKATTVSIVSGTNVIYVEVASHSPEKAAMIANKYSDLYIEERLRLKFEEARKVSKWLDSRLSELKKQVRHAEKAVARYRVENNLITTLRGEITGEQLTQLNSELVRAKGDLAAKMAKLNYTKNPDFTERDILQIPAVLKSRIIQQLKLQEIELLKKRSDLNTRYGKKHPSIQNINNELELLRSKIKAEARSILSGVSEEVLIARARLNALQEGFQSLISTRVEENDAMIRLRELMMEAESSRAIYNKFLGTYKRSTNQDELQEADARVISYAAVPNSPSYPNKPLFASLSAILMLFFGIALSLFLEKLDTAFKTVSQLESGTQFLCFGVIPELRFKSREQAVSILASKLASHAAENIRNLKTTLALRGRDKEHKPKVINITSSLPGEGKSTLSTWLALIAARSGDRVCLIDCDLRNPVLHQQLKGRGNNTLVEYLTGQVELSEVMSKDEKSGLHTIFAKPVPNSALDLIASRRMKNLIQALRQEFDYIILDGPSCLSVSDPKVLATLSDQTLYAVAWGQTERDYVQLGLKQFTDIGYYNVATVFTRVNLKSYAQLGFGASGYYPS